MVYKWCVVPQCLNTSIKTPEKLFVSVPKTKMRKKWLQLAQRNPNEIVDNSNVFFCEDHFNMEKDMANYNQYKMGFSQKILMVDGVLPSKFHCQETNKQELRKRLCGSPGRSPPTKKKKMTVEHEYTHSETNTLNITEFSTDNDNDNDVEMECIESTIKNEKPLNDYLVPTSNSCDSPKVYSNPFGTTKSDLVKKANVTDTGISSSISSSSGSMLQRDLPSISTSSSTFMETDTKQKDPELEKMLCLKNTLNLVYLLSILQWTRNWDSKS